MRRTFGLPDRTALPVVPGGRRGPGSRRFLVAAAAESSSDPEMAKQLRQWEQASMTASYSGDYGQFSSGRGGFAPSTSPETAAAQQWAVASSRRSEAGVPASHSVEVDESGKERVSYHQRLVVAAQQGSPLVAEDVIDAMNENGIPAGPRAYHGLVFSYVKAGDPEGALDAIKREYHSGVWPLPESYMVLIHGFVKAGDVTRAEAVFKSMRARMDAQPGWQVLTTALFEQGFAAQALDHLQRGREEGWKLNTKLYELQIRALAEMGEKERAQAELMRMREEGLKPEPCHVNPVIRVQAMGGAVEAAEVMVNDMMYATGPMPDIGTFNALLEGIVHDRTQDVRSKMSLTVGMMSNARVKPNEITHMLMLDGALREDRMAAAQEAYANLLSAVGVGTTRIIPDDLLAKYIGFPKQVVQLLQQVKKDKRSSLEGLCRPLDRDGRTFITSWLLTASQRNRSLRMRAADGTDQPFTAAADDDSVRFVDGVRIGIGNCVVDEEGNVVSASKLRVRELRAELEARGLSSEGKRDRLYSRLRASRASIKGLLEGLKKGTDKSRNKARNTLRQARGFLQNASIEANCSGETVKQVLSRELKEERLRRLREAGSSGSAVAAATGSRKRKVKHRQLVAIVDGKEVPIADPQAEKPEDEKEPDLDDLEEEEPPLGIKGELEEEGGGEEDGEEDAESMLEELEMGEEEEGNEAAGHEGGEDEDVVAPDAEMASPENALPGIDARDVDSDATNMWQVDVDERETYDGDMYEDSSRNDLTRIMQLARANTPSSHTSEQKKLLELLGQDDDEDSDSMPLQSSLTMLRMASSLGMTPAAADFRTLLRTAEVECRLDAVSLIIQALLKEVRAKAVEAQAAASAQHDRDGEEEDVLRPAAGGANDADGAAALDVGRWIGHEAQQMVVDLANEGVRVCLDQNKLFIARNIIDSVREETELSLDPQLVASVELSIRQQGAARQGLGDEEMAGIDRLDAALDEASVPGAAAN